MLVISKIRVSRKLNLAFLGLSIPLPDVGPETVPAHYFSPS